MTVPYPTDEPDAQGRLGVPEELPVLALGPYRATGAAGRVRAGSVLPVERPRHRFLLARTLAVPSIGIGRYVGWFVLRRSMTVLVWTLTVILALGVCAQARIIRVVEGPVSLSSYGDVSIVVEVPVRLTPGTTPAGTMAIYPLPGGLPGRAGRWYTGQRDAGWVPSLRLAAGAGLLRCLQHGWAWLLLIGTWLVLISVELAARRRLAGPVRTRRR